MHTKGKINALLSGILMMIALYSINLRILGKPTISLLHETTLFDQLKSIWPERVDSLFNQMFLVMGIDRVPSTWGIILVMAIVTFIIKCLLDYFLTTEVGLALRATGDNKRMIRSLAANTDTLIIMGIGLSNGLVAFSGALIAQNDGFADAQMGIGMIIVGLASVIIGEALFGTKSIARVTLAVVGGAIIYRIVVTMALRADFLEAGDMKLITAVLVIGALVAPKFMQARRETKRRLEKQAELNRKQAKEVS